MDAIWVLAQGPEAAVKTVSALSDLGWDGGLMFNEVVMDVPNIVNEFSDYHLIPPQSQCMLS